MGGGRAGAVLVCFGLGEHTWYFLGEEVGDGRSGGGDKAVVCEGCFEPSRAPPPRVSSPRVRFSRELTRSTRSTLRIGSTTLSVHIHPSLSCDTCAVATDSSNLIPLLATESTSTTTPDRPPESYTTKTKSQKEQDRREKMRGLKDQFLKPSSKPAPTTTPSTPSTSSAPKPFIDRAAARRQRTGSSKPPTPSPSPFFTVPGSAPSHSAPPTAPPPNPFASSSRGALLLSKMSGEPSGNAGGGLGTLIQAKSFDTKTTGREERPGLGSKKLVVIGEQVGSVGVEGKRGDRKSVV